jgi:hypothetical protein
VFGRVIVSRLGPGDDRYIARAEVGRPCMLSIPKALKSPMTNMPAPVAFSKVFLNIAFLLSMFPLFSLVWQ